MIWVIIYEWRYDKLILRNVLESFPVRFLVNQFPVKYFLFEKSLSVKFTHSAINPLVIMQNMS